MNLNYSPSNLQTYLICPRKFELRFIQKIIWPAVQTEPVLQMEEQVLLGKQFHLFAQQYFSGIDPDLIKQQIKNDPLATWWENFLKYINQFKSMQYEPEVILSARLVEEIIIGVFDLLAIANDGKFLIFDWKTNQKKPVRNNLGNQIQTRLYPLLFSLSGKQWNNNQEIEPLQIDMIYWFANEPDHPEIFQYSQYQLEQDKEYFKNLLTEIKLTKIGEFMLTPDERNCKFCQYRSLCNRGIKPGKYDDPFYDQEYALEEISDFDINQIGEIAF